MSRRTCLLIDDDEDDGEIFKMAIDQISADVNFVFSKSAMEAVKLLSEQKVTPDYIFLDINMPLMNGSECLAEIRKMQHLQNVPVYMYTTSAGLRDKNMFLEIGAREVVTKPTRLGDLVDILHELMELR